jgi:hypothetical protein
MQGFSEWRVIREERPAAPQLARHGGRACRFPYRSTRAESNPSQRSPSYARSKSGMILV